MWYLVGNLGDKEWIWLALDTKTREIVGVYVGDRNRDGAQKLWEALPPVYRQCAVSYTDFWSAYDEVFPNKRHQSVGNDSGKTSYMEKNTGGESLHYRELSVDLTALCVSEYLD